MRGDIAVIVDSASIVGFKAVGFKTFGVKNAAETIAAVEKLAEGNYCVIFVTEQALEGAEAILATYRDRTVPAIIPIPGRFGKTGAGMANIGKNVERAIGTNILELIT